MTTNNSVGINLGGRIPINLYNDVREDIARRFSKYEYVRGIYEFGKVKDEGISDLDLALVISNKTAHTGDIQGELEDIYRTEAYQTVLCGGTIMIFSDSDFENIQYLDDIEPILLAGELLNIKSPSQSDLENISICQILDWLPERLLSLRAAIVNQNSAISILGYLYSLRYTFKKINQLCSLHAEDRNQYIIDVETLRKQWFELDSRKQSEKISSLTSTALTLGFRDLNQVVTELETTGKYQSIDVPNLKGTFSLTPLKQYVQSGNKECWYRSSDISLGSRVQIEVPEMWFFLWLLYGRQPGPISKSISEHLDIKPTSKLSVDMIFGQDLTQMLKKRMALCNSMASFLRRNNFKKGLYKFGWFF